jgi:hypothetical protein
MCWLSFVLRKHIAQQDSTIQVNSVSILSCQIIQIPFFWGAWLDPKIQFRGSSRRRWRYRIQMPPSILGTPAMLGRHVQACLGANKHKLNITSATPTSHYPHWGSRQGKALKMHCAQMIWTYITACSWNLVKADKNRNCHGSNSFNQDSPSPLKGSSSSILMLGRFPWNALYVNYIELPCGNQKWQW